MTTPTPGKPLSEADVSLLQPGDWLLCKDGTVHRILSAIEGWVFVADWREPIRAFTYLGRPDQDGWIAHDGSVKGPVDGTGILCDFIMSDDREYIGQKHPRFWHLVSKWRPHTPVSRPGDGVEGENMEASAWRWLSRLYPNDAPADLAYDANEMVDAFVAGAGEASRMAKALWRIAEERQYRAGYCQTDFAVEPALTAEEAQAVAREALSPIGPALTPPAEPVSRPTGEGEREVVAWPVVTDQWAETYCELTGRDPDGQQVTFVDGGTVTTFRDMARREIEAMLCAAPKAAVRAIAALRPGGER